MLSVTMYSAGQLKRDSKNVSFCVSATTEIMKINNVPSKSPTKLLPEMKKYFWNVQNLLVLRTFFEKVSFWKMGVAGIKWGPYPSTIHSFSINLNEEALLKVSFKNIDKFQSCPFSKTTFFSKRALKVQKFFEKLDFFSFLVGIL